MKKNIFEKIRNFSALDERDCQAAWLFAHWGQFGRETRAWPDGADPPHFHMHIGKIGQFLEVWVFRRTNVGLCVDGPCKTAGHLQNTPGTPAMDFPLGASGSQSALYKAQCWTSDLPEKKYQALSWTYLPPRGSGSRCGRLECPLLALILATAAEKSLPLGTF